MRIFCGAVQTAPHYYSETGENMTKNVKRTIGDNSANINPIEDSAIKLIREIYENVIDVQKHASEAWIGKNKTVRDNNALMSAVKTNKMIQRFQSWFKVVEAKDNGVDVHSAPIKSHKLDIVSNMTTERFGQYIIDKDTKDNIDKDAIDKAAWEVLNEKK